MDPVAAGRADAGSMLMLAISTHLEQVHCIAWILQCAHPRDTSVCARTHASPPVEIPGAGTIVQFVTNLCDVSVGRAHLSQLRLDGYTAHAV